jgi:hypothetical protein
MTTITIALPHDRLLQLKAIANKLGIAPEETFRQAAEYFLKQNAELYRRLA